MQLVLWLILLLLGSSSPADLDWADIDLPTSLGRTELADAHPVEVEFEFYQAAPAPQAGWTEATTPNGQTLYLAPAAELTRDDVASVAVLTDEMGLSLLIQFTDAGAQKMAALSEQLIGQPLAIVVDGDVFSAPIIQATVSDEAVVTLPHTGFTPDMIEALNLTPTEIEALSANP